MRENGRIAARRSCQLRNFYSGEWRLMQAHEELTTVNVSDDESQRVVGRDCIQRIEAKRSLLNASVVAILAYRFAGCSPFDAYGRAIGKHLHRE